MERGVDPGAHKSGCAAAIEEARIRGADIGRCGDDGRCAGRSDLARFYDWFAATERTITLYSQGVNQSSAGTDKVNAIINCHLATGRLGRPGMGPLSLTGQPNAMGGREVGGLANQLAAHMGFSDAEIDRVRRFWGASRIAARPGLKAVELFDRVADGGIKALWVLSTNPAVSMPNARRVRDALAACPFVVVSDCWPTDTTEFADVVLPAAGCAGEGRHCHELERCIPAPAVVLPAAGKREALDWWMLERGRAADGLGRGVRVSQPGRSIFREHAALSGFENEGPTRRLFDIAGLATLGRDGIRASSKPVHWPLPRHSVRPRGASRSVRRVRTIFDRRRQGAVRAYPVPTSRRTDRRTVAAGAEYRPSTRPVAHDDANRPGAAPDGPYQRAGAAYSPAGCRAAWAGRLRPSPRSQAITRHDNHAGEPFRPFSGAARSLPRSTGPTGSAPPVRSMRWSARSPTRSRVSPS